MTEDPRPLAPTSGLRAPCRRRAALRSVAMLAGAAALLSMPGLVRAARVPVQMTDGPFYPPRAWRARWTDWDADLTRVEDDGRIAVARGDHLGLAVTLADTQGRAIDGAEVEIWQCDMLRHYRHPDVSRDPRRDAERFDAGFQGFGAARTARHGGVVFRTIRPVPYPGRTPHIHVKLRHPTFGEWTSQLFVAGDPGNERDSLWRRLGLDDRAALQMQLRPAPGAAAAAAAASGGAPPLAFWVDQALTLPA